MSRDFQEADARAGGGETAGRAALAGPAVPAGPAGPAARAGLLAALLAAVAAGLAAALLIPGRVVTTEMPTDVIHLIDAIARREAGQLAHIDFMTPMGDLSIEVMAIWRRLFGAPIGLSMLLGDVTVMVAALPLLVWAGLSRLGFWVGLAFGTWCLVLAGAAAWRVDSASATYAMCYNRWAWALAAPMLVLMLARSRAPGRGTDRIDALAIGLAGAALAWMKASYAVALLPVWLLWGVLTGRARVLALSTAIGALTFAAVPLALTGGPGAAVDLTAAYARDLMTVAGSSLRPAPGEGPVTLMFQPDNLLGIWLCLPAGLLLLGAGLRAEAAVWAAATAAVVAISWQNFGNDMLGVAVFGAVLPGAARAVAHAAPGLRLAGRPAPGVLLALGAVAAVIALQQVVTLNRSSFAGWQSGALPLMAAPLASAGAPDVLFLQGLSGIVGTTALAAPDGDGAAARIAALALLSPAQREIFDARGAREIDGVVFPGCELQGGWTQSWRALAAAWRARPDLAGRTVLEADVINAVWLAVGAPPQRGAQIWHYGALGPALGAADLLAVSRCPVSPLSRNLVLDEITAAGIALHPVLSVGLWEVYAIRGAPG
jgi:hypothetical protein